MMGMGSTASRIGDGVRSSTPGRGVSQWTSQPVNASQFNTGSPWMYSGEVNRVPIPTQPHILSDIAHRQPTNERLNVDRNHGHGGTFATSADAEYAKEQRRLHMMAERRHAHESRIVKMISDKSAYEAEVLEEHVKPAVAAHEAAAVQSRSEASQAEQRAAAGVHTFEQRAEIARQQNQQTRRAMHMEVAEQQRAQIEQRRQATARERAAERAGGDGADFFARFGTTLR